MKFGEIPTHQAEGTYLAHSVKSGSVSFKKGRMLSKADVAALTAAGKQRIWAARLDPGDVHEDEAATRLASALVSENIRANTAFTGRVNLYANCDGILRIDGETVNAFNRVSEAITFATLTPWARVVRGQMVATIKIIPFAVSRKDLDQAHQHDTCLSLEPFVPKTTGLILTQLNDTGNRNDKAIRIVRDRLQQRSCELTRVETCAHTLTGVTAAIDRLMPQVDLLLILGASAITDRGDIIPQAIENGGGQVLHYGMPVDPGNLLLLAQRQSVPIVGLPGCARSPSLNGMDWVLDRLCANVPVTSRDIQAMGVGGLLKEIPSRPQPREDRPAKPEPAKVDAIILAAGQSRRMGNINKLLAEIDGQTMIERVVSRVLQSNIRNCLVVTGHEGDLVRDKLGHLDIRLVHNPDFTGGLSTSLRAGLDALDADCSAAVICLGDMPDVSASHINALIDAFKSAGGHNICVPTFNGKRGNPVLWDAGFFAEMRQATGDTGARHLIGTHAEAVCEVEMGDDQAIVRDIDTPEGLDHFRRNESARKAQVLTD